MILIIFLNDKNICKQLLDSVWTKLSKQDFEKQSTLLIHIYNIFDADYVTTEYIKISADTNDGIDLHRIKHVLIFLILTQI